MQSMSEKGTDGSPGCCRGLARASRHPCARGADVQLHNIQAV